MAWLRQLLTRTPATARVAPFVAFVLLTFAQDSAGPTGPYWLYLAKTLLGLLLLAAVWPAVEELRWKISWAGVLVGVAVFAGLAKRRSTRP